MHTRLAAYYTFSECNMCIQESYLLVGGFSNMMIMSRVVAITYKDHSTVYIASHTFTFKFLHNRLSGRRTNQ